MANANSYGVTQKFEPDSGVSSADAAPLRDARQTHPRRIARYRIEEVLGQGGFGVVYLAQDERLERLVAVKTPHARLISRPEDAEAYLAEARMVAHLDHPHIVPVFDVGSTEDCPCFVVSKYIEGTDLGQRLKQQRFKYREAAELVATVAESLHYAHKQGYVHRDVKPGNILIGQDGAPYLVDFGLALREENAGQGPKYAGTPAYMSPEQARGEGHRVDGRSDIFSLGVVFYQLLAGRPPFRGDTLPELLEQVTSYEPRPPRQYDDRIPKELERICHKAMAKRASERYSTAKDMAEDLRLFLAEQAAIQSGTSPGGGASATPAMLAPQGDSTGVDAAASSGRTEADFSSGSQLIKIVPKGLRSFDAHDADFFLQLLPGPRDRNGLPDSLRFWKTRIEETDRDHTFSVGLIYGPSGCGKSSLVKAGLLPRLSDEVLPVYVEATPDETETRLLRGLRKRCPALEENLNLKETLAALRRGQGAPVGKKVLIVLDQFEQWLHAHKDEEHAELVQALRQCDGGRVQCIVMVRDDFWLAVSRFLKELEVRLVEGENSALADLFDLDHARKVLAAFGRAFGKLPDNRGETTTEQLEFLNQAVAGLAEDGKVVCVRLALFAEMTKGKPWTPATLKEAGGATGVGVAFLEETFSASTAPPQHRYHQKAARAVLKALLPESGADIKGEMKSYDELLEASGYAHRPNDFDDLSRILDGEIRLITPTDPAGAERDDDSVSHVEAGRKYYQLTHDYLVPSLRDWLTRKQRETRRGRAELRLAERSATWNSNPEHRFLPSWWENLSIRLWTDKRNWTAPQQKMMAQAGWRHGLRSLLLMTVLAAAGYLGINIRQAVVEGTRTTRAQGLVESLLQAKVAQVPAIVSSLSELREVADPLLKTRISQAGEDSPEKLRLALALLDVDEGQIDYLGRQLPVCTVEQFPVVREALLPYREKLTGKLWTVVANEDGDAAIRFQAAAALAQYAPEDERWQEIAPSVVQHLTGSISSVYFGQWLEFFEPARERLTDSLTALHADRSHAAQQREMAAFALAAYLRNQPDQLVEVILAADERAEFSALISALQPHAAAVRRRLLDEMQAAMPVALDKANGQLSDHDQELRDAHWRRQSLAATTLVHLGFGDDVWPLLKFTPHPSLRSTIIHHLGKLGTNHNALAARLRREKDVSIRRALIQSLGGLNPARLPPTDRRLITKELQALYVHDPDSGVHSSASWALRQWGEELPELPMGEPTWTDAQKQRIAFLTAEVEHIRQRIDAAEGELPLRQAIWERRLQERPAKFAPALREGLIAHFPLDEREGLDAANAVADQSGGAYAGPGQPEWIPGVIGHAVRLNGQGGHFACGDAFRFERTDAMSFGCWFLVDSQSPRGVLFGKFDQEARRGICISVDPPNGQLLCEWTHHYPEDALIVSGKAPAIANRWRHVVVTYDGASSASGVSVYLDGKPISPRVKRDTLTQSIVAHVPVKIGIRGTAYRYRGAIDDVRIYNRRLSEEDVRQLYDSGLRVLASVPTETRTPEQQALLASAYRSVDEPWQRLKTQLAAAEMELRDARWDGVRRWYVNGQGQTMVVIPNPTDFGGRQIGSTFAISTHETTVAEFRRFLKKHAIDASVAPTLDCPVHSVTWFQAAAYCNWLSEQEGIPQDQWIYRPNANGQYADGMTIEENALALTGYRLPTEAEWEYACRAGTTGSYGFGEPISLLERYARFALNTSGRSFPVEGLLPNAAGMFDMHGNALEWVQNPVTDQMAFVTSNVGRVLRSGAYYDRPLHLRSSHRYPNPSFYPDVGYGFRVARTLPPVSNGAVESR